MLAEIVLLHFALRRFDRHPGFAYLTFALLLVVEPSASVMLDPGAAILWELGRYFKLIQGMIVAGGQGSICLLLGLRLVKSANDRRDQAHASGGK